MHDEISMLISASAGLTSAEDIPSWIGDADVHYVGLWHTIHLTEDSLKKLMACKVNNVISFLVLISWEVLRS